MLHRCSHAGNRPIVEGILYRLRGGLIIVVNRHIAEPHVFVQAAIRTIAGAGDDGTKRLVGVESTDALYVSIGDLGTAW